MRSIFLLGVLICLPLGGQQGAYELPAEQRTGTIRRILVLTHSHLDIGFTRPPDEVARDYKDNIDRAIELAREYPDFRWSIESAWMLEQWLRRTDDEGLIAELGKLMREGRIELGVAFANMHSGLMSAEESNRLMYLGHKFRRRFGVSAPVAFQNDVPGFTWAYPRVMAGSGVKYLVTGLNLFIGGGNSLGVGQNPFYWQGPDGSRVLTWFTYDSYVEGYRWKLSERFSLGELERMAPRRLAWLERNGYRYDSYLLMASVGDNSDPAGALRILKRIRDWNRLHPELPMQMTTAEEFFRYLTGKYGDDFPTASGDAAGHWEIVKLRAPEAAARVREAVHALPAAEALATLMSAITGAKFPRFDFTDAWNSLLTFHEHTADSGGGWPGYFSRRDADWSNIAHYAAAMDGFSNAKQQFRKAHIQLAAHGTQESSTQFFSVYNGLSWKRSGPVIVDRLPSDLREGPLIVTDLVTGKPISWQEIPGTKRHIAVFAQDVPSIGYRTYSIARGEASMPTGPFPIRVGWNDAGWITSIFDDSDGGEMLKNGPIGALHLARGREDFRREPLGPASVRSEEGPVFRRVEFARQGSALPLTAITLYANARYADLRFDVDLNALRGATSGNLRYAIALPFHDAQQMHVDGAGFIMRVPQDTLPGGEPSHYMPAQFVHAGGVTLANIDAFALRKDSLFVLAAESLEARTRDEGVQHLFRTEPRSSPVQSFRFRIALQKKDPGSWKRLGAEANLPLRAMLAQGIPSPPQRAFITITDDDVQLAAFKPAEFRTGWYVLRLHEMAGKRAENVAVGLPFRVAEAQRASIVEEPLDDRLDLDNLTIPPWSTLTLLLRIE